jgi:hypothetical protein
MVPAWHARFLALLPQIRLHARIAFRGLPPEAREEAIAEVVANVLVAYARLVQLGKEALAFASVLANYGVAQVREGRRVGGRRSINDILSPCAQRRKNFRVERLDRFDGETEEWREAVVQDTRSMPVADVVGFRMDFSAWLGRLPGRDRRLAERLALGHRTSDVAAEFRLSPGRISQKRREFHWSWQDFQGEQPRDNSLRAMPAAPCSRRSTTCR